MFLLVSVRHVGAHPDEFQHGVSIQSSINLGKTFPRISRIRIIPSTQILARVFVHLPPFTQTHSAFYPHRKTVRIFAYSCTHDGQTRLDSGVISYFVDLFCEKNLGQIQSISLINRNSDVVSRFVEIFCEKRGTNTR